MLKFKDLNILYYITSGIKNKRLYGGKAFLVNYHLKGKEKSLTLNLIKTILKNECLDIESIDDYRKKMLPVFKEGILNQWFSEMTGCNRATDGWLSRGMLTWFNDYINYSTTNESVDRKLKEILDEAEEKYPEAMNMKLNEKTGDAERRITIC